MEVRVPGQEDWDIEFTKIGKHYNAYPQTEEIKPVYQKNEDDDSDSEWEDEDEEEKENKFEKSTILNLGAFSKGTGERLNGLLKVLTDKCDKPLTDDDDFRINFIKYNPGKDDIKDQKKVDLTWNTYRYPGVGPIPEDAICTSEAISRSTNYCNAHTSVNDETRFHYPYCQNPDGKQLYLSTKAFIDKIINSDSTIQVAAGEELTAEIIKGIKTEWEDGNLSMQSVYNLFNPSPQKETSANIRIIKHNNTEGENEFHIASISRDADVNDRGIDRLSGKMGFYVKIKPGSECVGGDPNILTKLENLMSTVDALTPGEVIRRLGIGYEDIFGIPKEARDDSASTSIIGIKWSAFPRPGQKKKEKNEDRDKKFEGPIQINFKKDEKSSSVRIYNSGKIIAVNLPIYWDNKLEEVLNDLINEGDVLNKEKWYKLMIKLHTYDSKISYRRNYFNIIPQLTFITVLHGEIYYNKEKIILNLNNVKNYFETINVNSVIISNNKDRLIVKFNEGVLSITLQIYTKNFADKRDKKAIAQIDISIIKDGNDIPAIRLDPEGDEINNIKTDLQKHLAIILQNPTMYNKVRKIEEEKITDKMRQDFVVPGRIPQKKIPQEGKKMAPMYPCRTAKERPVPYNFTGQCDTAPWNSMNYPGVKSEIDNRYYPCCAKNIPKNIAKNRLALQEGFPHNDRERQLYNLPQEGEIDWHSGVFSNPIIPGQNVDIEDDGELKNATIINVSGRNNTNIIVSVDGVEKEIKRSEIIPQNRSFKGLVDVPEEKLRSEVKEFCQNNSDKCKGIDLGFESKEKGKDPFSELGIDRQNIVPLSASGFESFTKVPYIAAAVPVGAKETYIWLRPDGIFEVDDSNPSIKISEKCLSPEIGTVENILLHVFKYDDKFLPIDVLYWTGYDIQKDSYIRSDGGGRIYALYKIYNECLRDKMINPFIFINYPGREQAKAPSNIQEHTKNIVDAGYNILFIPQEGEPFYSCCPRIFDQTIKMKIIGDSVGGGDGILNDVIFEKGIASDGEVWNFRLDISDMNWNP